MDQFKKLFKKDSLAEKRTRRKQVRRSRSMPLDYEVEEDPPKAVYRGKGPLRASRIKYIESSDRDLPCSYKGTSVLDISKVRESKAAKDWWKKQKGFYEEPQERHADTKRTLNAPPKHGPLHKDGVHDFTRRPRDHHDLAKMCGLPSDNSVTSDTGFRIIPDDDSLFEERVRADLRARYKQAYGQPGDLRIIPSTKGMNARGLRQSQSTMTLDSHARMRQGPVSHRPEVHQQSRRPSQVSHRGETGVFPPRLNNTSYAKNKPLPPLPTSVGQENRFLAPSSQHPNRAVVKQPYNDIRTGRVQPGPGWI